jgi:hypothetical protein
VRHEDHGQLLEAGLAANAVDEIESRAPGQADVEHGEVGLLVEQDLPGVVAVVRRDDAKAVRAERDVEELDDARVVLDHEDRGAGTGSALGFGDLGHEPRGAGREAALS